MNSKFGIDESMEELLRISLLKSKNIEEFGVPLRRIKDIIYTNESEIFTKIPATMKQQYSSYYKGRLNALSGHVRSRGQEILGESIAYPKDILSAPIGKECFIIGTIYKSMPHKPNILLNIDTILDLYHIEKYTSEDDKLYIEDLSCRMEISFEMNSSLRSHRAGMFVSGCVVGFRGLQQKMGTFIANDIITGAGIPKQISSLPDGVLGVLEGIKENPQKQFVAFLSGLEFSHQDRVNILPDMLAQYLVGNMGQNDISSRIIRLIIAGNSIIEPKGMEQVARGSFRNQKLNAEVYSILEDNLSQFEHYLSQISSYIPISIMPGSKDLTDTFLPQQPIHQAIFSNVKNVELVSNPYSFTINGVNMLGVSGQNIKDIIRSTDLLPQNEEGVVDLMENMLNWRHICPTAPETIRTYAYEEMDPFLLENTPHVYFVSNSKSFETKLITFKDKEEKGYCRLISIPVFKDTPQLILLDINSLQVFQIQFHFNYTQFIKYINTILHHTNYQINITQLFHNYTLSQFVFILLRYILLFPNLIRPKNK